MFFSNLGNKKNFSKNRTFFYQKVREKNSEKKSPKNF